MNKLKAEFCKKYGISPDKKIILYAPTWRDNQHESGLGYTYDIGIDFEKLHAPGNPGMYPVHY